MSFQKRIKRCSSKTYDLMRMIIILLPYTLRVVIYYNWPISCYKPTLYSWSVYIPLFSFSSQN